ncbi:AraC family ligand binding domain-containing protein [Lentilactobacillus hilgardii]|uniref:AraC family ligand binding domain-containing protein n=1 Tax=Lentilactobacillus hilgardii TaxID=1588 RepID=UPI0039EAB0D7
MRITFTRVDHTLPLFCENIGYDWQQEHVQRPNGYYFFHWIQSEIGTGIVKIDNDAFSLNPNQGLLIRSNVPHEYYASGPDPKWQTQFFVFSGTIANELMAFVGLKKYIYIPKLSPELSSFIINNFKTFSQDDLKSALKQSAAIYRFIMLIKQDSSSTPNSFEMETIINPIAQYINEHYSTEITNKHLSSITGYSISYQNRVFAAHYGITPLKYLTEYRLRQAKSLLMIHPD